MIILALCGFGLLIVIAVIVGIEDAVHAPRRRIVAKERQRRWEARRLLANAAERDHDGEDDETRA